MDSFNVNQVDSSAVRPRPELPRILPTNDEERRSTNSQDNFTLYNWYGVPSQESDYAYGLNLANNSATATINGVPSYSLPLMDIISTTLKKQILEGRDVNLAALLMKDYESVQAASSLHKSSGLEINLPGKKDARLHRSLSLKQIVCAFGKYKRVLCRIFPQRN
jgi:hypothetical protein